LVHYKQALPRIAIAGILALSGIGNAAAADAPAKPAGSVQQLVYQTPRERPDLTQHLKAYADEKEFGQIAPEVPYLFDADVADLLALVKKYSGKADKTALRLAQCVMVDDWTTLRKDGGSFFAGPARDWIAGVTGAGWGPEWNDEKCQLSEILAMRNYYNPFISAEDRDFYLYYLHYSIAKQGDMELSKILWNTLQTSEEDLQSAPKFAKACLTAATKVLADQDLGLRAPFERAVQANKRYMDAVEFPGYLRATTEVKLGRTLDDLYSRRLFKIAKLAGLVPIGDGYRVVRGPAKSPEGGGLPDH
jgi:hypothetical protein